MPDVEFFDLGDRGDRPDVANRQPVTGVDGETEFRALGGGGSQGFQRSSVERMMRITTGVKLNRVGPEIPRSEHGLRVRVDEEAATDAGRAKSLYRSRQALRLTFDVEPPFGGDLLPPLGHDCGLARADPFGQCDDRLANRHLQVQHCADSGREALYVGVLNVPAILTEVRGNPIGPGAFADQRRRQRIRFIGASRLTNRGDVIDVDEQTLVCGVHGSVRFAVWRAPPVDPPGRRNYVRIQTALEPSVRKWALLVITVAACARTPSMGSSLTGAPTARDAATMFVGAAQSQDLQAMGAVWGSDKGAARDNMERSELDRRLIILQPCYMHDRAQVLDEQLGASATERRVRIQLTRANRTKNLEFKVVRGPSDRWYVEDANYEAVQTDFCRPG